MRDTAGTVVGLLAASALVHWVPAGDWYQIVLIAVFCFGMRWAGPGNIALSAASLAALVVVLLTINGVPAHSTVLDRSLATLVGGSLAICATLIRPTWERNVMTLRLADLLAAYGTFLALIAWRLHAGDCRLSSAPEPPHRLARTNAQASIEPGSGWSRVLDRGGGRGWGAASWPIRTDWCTRC